MSVICARLGSKGKVGVQRGRKTAGCPSFLPPRGGRRDVPAVRRRRIPRGGSAKNSPPVRGEPANAVRVPRTIGAEKETPRQGEHANAVRVPRLSGAEKEPPRQGEPACGSSRAPVGRCRKKSRPVRGEHADAVRVPRWVGAENPGNPEKIFPPEKAAKTPVLTLRKRLSERYS